MNEIELQERIYISKYLEELKENIQKVIENYDLKYFKKENRFLIFLDSRNRSKVRAFYGSEDRFISLDLWSSQYYHVSSDKELIRFYLNGLQDKSLWEDGTYFEYVVMEIVKLFKGIIKVVD